MVIGGILQQAANALLRKEKQNNRKEGFDEKSEGVTHKRIRHWIRPGLFQDM